VILLDTNVLVYAVNADSPQYSASRAMVQAALDRRLAGVLVPQILLEFFAVTTNSRRVTRPLGSEQAWEQVAMLRANLPVLDLRPTAFTILGELVAARRSTGRSIFDLFLAAQMRIHGVRSICTYNGSDFGQLPDIEAVTPEDALGSALQSY
jgi:predicted nucleic acid-binding protein